MHYFDSHCHLQDERFNGRLDAVMERARAAGVTHMLCCGTQESDWDAVAALSEKHPEIIPAFGLHPWFVANRTGTWLNRLEEMLHKYPQAALGEIGLDHAIDQRNDADQATVFLAQLRLARKLERRVSIHCRKAWGDLLCLLEQQCGLPHGGAVHSYSGPHDLIKPLALLNASFSFSGSITYDRNRRGRSAAAVVPDDRLLVETDAPDIPPQGIDKDCNEPAHLALVAGKLAELRGVTLERIAHLTSGNGIRLFAAV